MTPVRRAWFAVACGLAVALLLAVVFRGPLLKPLIVLVLRQTLGLHATISHVKGNIATGLVLEGVLARGEVGAGGITTLEAGSLGARYSLAALLRGRQAFVDSLDVSVEGARIDLDLTASPAAGAPPAGEAAGFPSFPPLPRLTVRDSRLRVSAQGYLLEADGLKGTVERANQGREQAVAIQAGRLSLRHPSLREGVFTLAIAGMYAPRRLSLTAGHLDGTPVLERGTLSLGEQPGDLDLQLVLNLWQGSIEFGMIRRAAGTELIWNARGVQLQPQLVLVNPALGDLRGELSTSGAVTLGGAAAALTGTIALDWKGALIAGRAVDHLMIEGSAKPGEVLVERAEGLIGPNEVRLHRVILPAAPLLEARWRALLAGASGDFTASLGDIPKFLALWGVETGKGPATVPEHLLLLEGSLEKGVIHFARANLATGIGKAALDGVTVSFPREDQGWGETGFSGDAALDIPNLNAVSALFPLPPLTGSLRGEISGAGTFVLPEGRLSLTGRGISVAGRVLGDLEVQAHGTAGMIEIDTLRVIQGGSRFTANGFRFSPATLATADGGAFLDGLAGSFTLGSTDLAGLAALAGIPRETVARLPRKHLLTVAGTMQGRTLVVTAGSFAAAGATITLHAARIALPPAGADLRKDTTFEGDLEAGIADLGAIAAIFELPPLKGTLEGRVTFSGNAGAPTLRVEGTGGGIIVDGHRVGDVILKAEVKQQRLRVETLEVTRGKDRLSGHGAYDLGQRTVLEAAAEITLADVSPYLAEFVREGIPVSGRLHATLRAAGPLPASPIVIVADFSEGRIQGVQGVRASLNATYEPGRLKIGALELNGAGGLAVTGEGTVPLDLFAKDVLGAGPLAVRAKANIPALEDLAFLVPAAYALKGSLSADVGITGSWKEPEARLEVRGERLELPPGTRFVRPGPHSLAGTLVWNMTEARAEKVRLESSAYFFTLSGSWASPPPLRSLFAGSGGAAAGSLSLRSSFSSPDIGWLQGSVAGLRGLRGSVSGEIALEGTFSEPLLSGEIRVAHGALRYRDLPPLDALTVRATVARRSVALREFSGNLGGSPFTLEGSLDLTSVEDPVLDLRLQGKNALLYRDEGLRVRADSDLTLRGPLSALSLSGELALTDSLYQKDITIASLFSGGEKAAKRTTAGLAGISFPDPPLRDMRFDVRLTAREPFQIKTTVVRGAARPDMRLTGTGLLPILRGPILVDNAWVMLPSGALEIERGTVLYREGDPDRPTLDFGGRMQTRGYEITAQIGGTLDDPEVILSSMPPLPREELLLFVLTGAPPGSGGADSGSFTAMASPMAVYLGKNVVGQLLGGTKPGKTNFQDRIELQIGREMTRSGSVTIDARLLFKKEPLGRGSSLFITSEKDIYDQYNAGLKILFKFK